MSPTKPSAAGRTTSSGSFHAGAPIPSLSSLRRQSTYHYQTFPTTPPAKPRSQPKTRSSDDASSTSSAGGHGDAATPLPVRQLLLLAFLSLAEQTALNSIAPYLPDMVESMPGIPDGQAGLYVGILASAFALAQLSTNFLWGYASDVIGRKPVLLLGTLALMACFCVFGLCTRYWHIVVVHVAMGLLNGNAACVPTVLGEVTDRSNQSRAFTYLPVIYSLGSITGPGLGGILVGRAGGSKYPYLAPNILSAAVLACSFIVVAIWFEETLDEAEVCVARPAWVDKLISAFRFRGKPQRTSWSSRWPRVGSNAQAPLIAHDDSLSDDEDEDDDDDEPASESGKHETALGLWRQMSGTTLLLLCTYLVFQLSNISFNSLYPIFAASPPPTGRDLLPSKIGISLSLASVATIVFQAFLFQPFKARLGNLGTYQLSLLGLGVSMMLMPWVGYRDGKPPFGLGGSGTAWLYAELGIVLVLKNMCAVAGLSSVMLLITNSAPSHDTLGSLNGIAQTLSALGRSIGPFAAGGLFTLSMDLKPKGEALAWCLFGGLGLCGWFASVFIRGDGLESDDWVGSSEDLYDEQDESAERV